MISLKPTNKSPTRLRVVRIDVRSLTTPRFATWVLKNPAPKVKTSKPGIVNTNKIKRTNMAQIDIVTYGFAVVQIYVAF